MLCYYILIVTQYAFIPLREIERVKKKSYRIDDKKTKKIIFIQNSFVYIVSHFSPTFFFVLSFILWMAYHSFRFSKHIVLSCYHLSAGRIAAVGKNYLTLHSSIWLKTKFYVDTFLLFILLFFIFLDKLVKCIQAKVDKLLWKVDVKKRYCKQKRIYEKNPLRQHSVCNFQSLCLCLSSNVFFSLVENKLHYTRKKKLKKERNLITSVSRK